MQNKRREFLKKSAVAAATLGASGAIASGLKSDKLPAKIKNQSGKKSEILYKRSPEWELFYKQAK